MLYDVSLIAKGVDVYRILAVFYSCEFDVEEERQWPSDISVHLWENS